MNSKDEILAAIKKRKKAQCGALEALRQASQAVDALLADGTLDQESADELRRKIKDAEQEEEHSGMIAPELFVTLGAGQPFRLFPFGAVWKNGKKREITPEYAARFRLPHFKPPIKLGSHDETTPAGGYIVGLSVGPDGLYAVPEMNEQGTAALQRGDYRYQSPEVIWDEGYLEDPQTGEAIYGPLIVGDALLHTPHLGEAAALFTIETESKEVNTMEEETVTMSKLEQMWEKLLSRFTVTQSESEPEALQAETPAVDYTAVVAERDEYKAQVEQMQADQARRERLAHFGAELGKTKAAADGAEMLASMTDEQAGWVLQQFRALSAQVDEGALVGEIGSAGAAIPDDPRMALDQAVQAYAAEHKTSYPDALLAVIKANPDLAQVYKK